MTPIKLSEASKFSYPPHIFAALKAVAIDLARSKLEVAGVSDFTDNSTGTAAASVVALSVPSAAYDATSAGGAQRAAFNTAIAKTQNAFAVLAKALNNARVRIAHNPMTGPSDGTVAADNTIPAQDLTVASATGTSALDYATGRAAMLVLQSNLDAIVAGMNGVLVAMGEARIGNADSGGFVPRTLNAITLPSASASGASAISKTVADAFLTAMANNIATLAAVWNTKMVQGGLSALTDNSTGTAAAGLAANTLPTAASGAATTSAPKAAFDTQLGLIANAVASITSRMNAIRQYYDLPVYTNNSGGSVSTTIAAESAALSAVDGSSGTLAVDQASALARMSTIDNALVSLRTGINDLAPYFGVPVLTNALVGTASTTIAAIAATATGVGGGTNDTLLNADVNTWLGINKNNIATLVAQLNRYVGTNAPSKSLSIVYTGSSDSPSQV